VLVTLKSVPGVPGPVMLDNLQAGATVESSVALTVIVTGTI
jgi:hypothetical protein